MRTFVMQAKRFKRAQNIVATNTTRSKTSVNKKLNVDLMALKHEAVQ